MFASPCGQRLHELRELRLQYGQGGVELLAERRFDREVEALCAKYYAGTDEAGRPSIPPGVYFRMLLIGYFEGIESERGIAWRCADSLSLKHFLGVAPTAETPDHSSLSRIRKRLPKEVYVEVFRSILSVVESRGLLRGKVVGVDSTYLRADASMRAIVRRDTGEKYQKYLERLAKAEGISNPTAEDCRRMDKKRKKMEHDQAVRNKEVALFNALISVATAVASALGAGPGVGIVLSIITAALHQQQPQCKRNTYK